jgi:HD-GYP domain-containing protein (c-di-GMP phosphodiesterase class II)
VETINPTRKSALKTSPADTVPLQQVAHSLTVALGTRDHHTRLHSDRVVRIANELGIHIELTGHELDMLALGAQFHDLGKIGIPDSVLRKPAPFEPEEWDCMRQHAIIGEQMILAVNGEKSGEIARVVRHHHEHFNGSGYPDGLSGTKIPLYSRIISLADSYDAMTATRPYHAGRKHGAVMDILCSESGIKHDPDLLHAFCAVIEKSPLRATDD